MNANAQIVRNNPSAARTFLRRASGIDQHARSTSTFRLVERELYESPPGYIGDAPVDDFVSVRLHILNIQLFKYHQPEAIDQFAAFLVGEVVAPIVRALVGVKQRLDCLTAFGTAFGQLLFLTLKPGDVTRVFLHPALALDLLTIGKHSKGFQAQVNAHHLARNGQGVSFNFAGEANVPFADAALNRDRFDVAPHGTVQNNLHVANLRQSQHSILQRRAVAVLRVGDAIVSPIAFEAWIARLVARFHTTKEGLKGKINAHLNVLQHLGVYLFEFRPFRLPRGEHPGSGIVVQAFATLLVSILAGSQRAIVDEAAQLKRLLKLMLLRPRRLQTELVGQSHTLK